MAVVAEGLTLGGDCNMVPSTVYTFQVCGGACLIKVARGGTSGANLGWVFTVPFKVPRFIAPEALHYWDVNHPFDGVRRYNSAQDINTLSFAFGGPVLRVKSDLCPFAGAVKEKIGGLGSRM